MGGDIIHLPLSDVAQELKSFKKSSKRRGSIFGSRSQRKSSFVQFDQIMTQRKPSRRGGSRVVIENDTWPLRKGSLSLSTGNTVKSPRRDSNRKFYKSRDDASEYTYSEDSVIEEIESSVDGIENEIDIVSDCLELLSKNYSKSQLTEK